MAWVRSFMGSVDTIARALGIPLADTTTIRIARMSSAWLREHDFDSAKHRVDE